MRGFGLHPDVLQYLPDISTVRDERDDAHLPTAQRAQQREHLLDAGDQHRPQVMGCALGWLGLDWERVTQRCKPRRTQTSADYVGLHRGRLRRCRHSRDCCLERQVWCQHPELAVPVGARRRHQSGDDFVFVVLFIVGWVAVNEYGA